ncbi:T9SS type A sorting domain-containing protein [Psychroserpens luteolus]|uniref:T9SS type A sorting domain-containing protein n=1 Tax=Psychroserpens luteolus TaxID=2855840 RepID=UPI001E42D017|nr:T9SS type A sorting domain-containing protein [Psychroserpens luteolus]MCD2259676.1 T9SS type A sorting domain-containing protein [Psychroserpens luteolus]
MKKGVPIKKLLLLLTIFCSITNAVAQHVEECGTVFTPESESYFKKILPQVKQYEEAYFQNLALRRSSTAISSVPIKAHIIRNTDGTGGLTASQLNDAIANMNAFYANALLEFFLCDGINYIDDSTYFDYETNEEAALTAANNVNNVINIYFANTVVNSSSGSGLCGYAYFPGGPEVILMNNNCAMNGSTLPHEMGHFFALSHTHGPSNSTQTTELVDGSNCDTDGDFICDTPADPQLGYSNVSAFCDYTGNDTDANGDTFAPAPRNIMSYSRKECRDEFSPQQYARIYGIYQASRSAMACPSFNVDITSNFTRDCSNSLDVDFTDNSVGATSWEWDVDGDDIIDYTTQNPSHTYTSSGAYDVRLTISNGSSSLTKVYQEYIEVGGEDIATTEIVLTLVTDDWPAETSWNLKDSSGTILYSSPTYTEGVDDFQTFTENFVVTANECYTFEMIDGYGDGICCASGAGSYTLTTLEGSTIVTGGAYGFGEITYMSNNALSVDDYFNNNTMSVYPNPTKAILNIKLANTNDLPDAYTIYNVLGQTITTKTISQVADLSIPTESFSEGVYYLKVSKGTNSNTIPFIKN